MEGFKHLVRLMLVGFTLAIMAACGGGGDDNDQPATAVPTLTDAERAAFAPGLAENPLQMALRPIPAVETAIIELIGSLSEEGSGVTLDASVGDDLGVTVDELVGPLGELFGVTPVLDTEAVQTVGDVIVAVYDALGRQISDEIRERTGLYVEVITVERPADALQALCASNSGIVSIAWMDGVSYAAAETQLCGDPALQVVASNMMMGRDVIERVELPVLETATPTPTVDPDVTPSPVPTATETLTPTPSPEPTETPENETVEDATPEATEEPVVNGDTRTGSPVLILLNRDLGTENIGAVQGRTFCRLGYDDFETWLLPSLLLIANDIDPLNDPGRVDDYDTPELLVSAVAEGRCDAAGLTQDMYDALESSLVDDLRVAAVSAEIPYAILMYPLPVQLGVRLSLNELFIELAVEEDGAGQSLRWLLGQAAVMPVDESMLAEFESFLQATGLNFEQLGN